MAKNRNFFFLLFTEKGRMTVFSDLLDRKLAILYYKNIDLKKSKVLHFFNVVSPWFLVKKWKFCPFVFFSKIGQKKVFSDLLDRKLAILYHKNIDLKKSEILHFSKGVSPWLLVKNWKLTLLCFEAK